MIEHARHAPPPPTWARIAAHLAALTPVPSALWRLLLVLGFSAGYTGPGLAGLDLDGAGRTYLILLGVLSEAAALLTLGLVSDWGERVPQWVPRLGGRVVNPRAAVVAAALGSTGLIVLWTPMVAWWSIPHPDLTARGASMIGIVYLPLVAWAPLLIAVTVSYHRRHRGQVEVPPHHLD